MKHHLNTLFVTTQGVYLFKQGEAVVVRVERENKLRVPLNNLGSIVCFGRVSCSPPLLGACGQRGVAVSFLTERGRFLAAVNGFTSGNVLLRREQYRRTDDEAAAAEIARACVVGKLVNYRTVLRRAAREDAEGDGATALSRAADRIGHAVQSLDRRMALDVVRGMEGDSSATYFKVFDQMIVAQKESFHFSKRSRRPPLDRVNSLLSFLYTMLALDSRAAWTPP